MFFNNIYFFTSNILVEVKHHIYRKILQENTQENTTKPNTAQYNNEENGAVCICHILNQPNK